MKHDFPFKSITFRNTSPLPLRFDRQKGAVLVITIVVLLGLTILALAATKSNQIQSIMVRNNQFRLDAFNVAYSEIDAQVDAINRRAASEGVPRYIETLIISRDDTRLSSVDFDGNAPAELEQVEILAPSDSDQIIQEVAQGYQQGCIVFGVQQGAGSQTFECHRIQVESEARIDGTALESDQRQVFEYVTL